MRWRSSRRHPRSTDLCPWTAEAKRRSRTLCCRRKSRRAHESLGCARHVLAWGPAQSLLVGMSAPPGRLPARLLAPALWTGALRLEERLGRTPSPCCGNGQRSDAPFALERLTIAGRHVAERLTQQTIMIIQSFA